MAKTIGLSAIDNSISGETMLEIDSPIKTSASFMASSRVFKSLCVENSSFSTLKFSLSLRITPLESSITMFSLTAPKARYKREQEIAAAPAPLMTILTSSIFLPASSTAFKSAAAEIMAVPC